MSVASSILVRPSSNQVQDDGAEYFSPVASWHVDHIAVPIYGPQPLASCVTRDTWHPVVRLTGGDVERIVDEVGDTSVLWEIAVDRYRRLDIYESIRRLQRERHTTPMLLVRSAQGPASTDFARIRWLAHVYRDLGCAVRYALRISSAHIDRLVIAAAFAAGAQHVALEVGGQQPSLLEDPALKAALAEIEALASDYGTVAPPTELFPSLTTGRPRRGGERVGALVAARSASTRLPRKALIDLAGAPSIVRIIERVKACRGCAEVVLCTTTGSEDDELAALAQREGAKVFRGSPDNVAIRLADAAHGHRLDHVVRVTGDNPLIPIELVNRCVDSHVESGADYTSTPNVFPGGGCEVVSVRALDAIVARAVRSENTEYLTWYLDDPSVFRINVVAAGAHYDRGHRLTLDTAEDLVVMRAIYEALYRPGIPVDAVRALDWLDAHPDIAAVNQHVRPKLDRRTMNVDLNL